MEKTVRTEFRLDHDTPETTEEMKATFADLGYIIIRGLLSTDEVDMVIKAANSDRIQREAYGVPDAHSSPVFMAVWNKAGNDVTGMVARSQKVAGTATKLMGGEIYHYHSKLIMKDEFVGGKFEWHQDYGYWYHNGLLLPDCMSVSIALNKCTKANGCLQIIPGSQKCGRIEHCLIQGQSRADDKRVEELKKKFSLKYVELEPGDAFFFHGNVLHTSGPNTSEDKRWTMLCCYNMAHNNPTFAHHHSSYVPLNMVPNTAIMDCKTPYNFEGKDFMDPSAIKSGQLRFIRRGESIDALRG